MVWIALQAEFGSAESPPGSALLWWPRDQIYQVRRRSRVLQEAPGGFPGQAEDCDRILRGLQPRDGSRSWNQSRLRGLVRGPGIYRNGEGIPQKSIPILVCETARRDDLFRRKVHLWFNEGDPSNYQQLKAAIESVPGSRRSHTSRPLVTRSSTPAGLKN